MQDINFFSDQKESTWLEALPNYQKEIISELLASKSLEETALAWIEASVDNTSPFTGQPQPEKKYLPLLKKEIHKLLCGNPEYEADRNELAQLTQTKENNSTIVSMVSALIGAKVGLAATFIAPAVVIIFMMIAKTSLNAWCAMETSENS
ncbi:hypothetical protein [Bacillus sp. es.034]|uniref:hypothetical protein n=1 Tax=Bacillus sp. es.034 TaxID=1761763 RepID=UPI000BF2D394|nr:hypothetical protein [Bacillus sp. es.034]PFG05245.1 hypothetical protein ATG71_2072 [Bacillus sp. es.034]